MDAVPSALQLVVLIALMCQCASCDGKLRQDPLRVRQEPLRVRQEPLRVRQEPLSHNLIRRLDDIQVHLAQVTSSMGDLVSGLENALEPCEQPSSSSCIVSLGVHTSKGVRRRRSVSSRMERHFGLLQDLQRKRTIMQRLMATVHDTDDVIRRERKRSCNVNLGFHCATEDIEDFANMLDFINSADSPGKRAA